MLFIVLNQYGSNTTPYIIIPYSRLYSDVHILANLRTCLESLKYKMPNINMDTIRTDSGTIAKS